MKECLKCGNNIKAGKKFCGQCGAVYVEPVLADIEIIEPVIVAQAKICTDCGAEIKPGKKFCGQCGAAYVEPAIANNEVIEPVIVAQAKICTDCGAEIKPGKKFCGQCGMTSAETLPGRSHIIPLPKKKLTKKPVFWVASAAVAFVMIAAFSSDTNTIPNFSAQAETPVFHDYDYDDYDWTGYADPDYGYGEPYGDDVFNYTYQDDYDEIAYAPFDENYSDGVPNTFSRWGADLITVSSPPPKNIPCTTCNGSGCGTAKKVDYINSKICHEGEKRNPDYRQYIADLNELAVESGKTIFLIQNEDRLIGISLHDRCGGKRLDVGGAVNCIHCHGGQDYYFPESLTDVKKFTPRSELASIEQSNIDWYMAELAAIYGAQASRRREINDAILDLTSPGSSSRISGSGSSGSSSSGSGSFTSSSPCARVDCSATAESGKAYCSVHRDSMSSNQFCYDAHCRNKPLAGSVYCATHK
ncbi:MAG: zinc ribbon domain-containing protein [Lachnospiraceae bacterium]|nr:zinc ribbon domain-containing protein [Lachnospiraceae bacterium]